MVTKLKRVLSCILTSIMLFTCISSSITVKSVDISNIFTYKSFINADSTQYYALMGLVDNYQTILGGITEITLPETYDKAVLNAIVEEANNFYEENQYYKDDYDTTAWNNVYHRSGTFPKANISPQTAD